MPEAALSDEELGALEAEMAQVCGVLNAATGRLVALIAKALATGAWQQTGICSPVHWVAWQCGVSPAHARSLVSMANRLGELPAIRAALEAGSLSEDQARVVCRHAPAGVDAEVAGFAQRATVSQLTRSLSRYVFAGGANGQPVEDSGSAPPEEVRTVSFGSDDDACRPACPPTRAPRWRRPWSRPARRCSAPARATATAGPIPAVSAWTSAGSTSTRRRRAGSPGGGSGRRLSSSSRRFPPPHMVQNPLS